MDRSKKLELLDQQIAAAQDGQPGDFDVWRQTTEVVLRNVLGDANPLYDSFKNIRYGLSIWTDSTPEEAWARAQAGGVREAIAILKAAKVEVEIVGGLPESAAMPAGKQVFIVHGHDEARKHEVARFVTKVTKNEPVILHEQAGKGRTIIEKFEAHAADTGYAIVIATGDDVGRSRLSEEDQLQLRARQNVVLELGFFFGALGRSRTALLYEDGVERPSDIEGIARISLDGSEGWKLELARELEGAGIGIDWSGLR
jgi:predicted nucleotide-binding protein